MNEEFVYFSGHDLQKDIGSIRHDQIKPFFSEGLWSMHDLLVYLLGITGPAEIWISTFSISEAAIRAIFDASERGMVYAVHCLFDHTIPKNKLSLLFFAHNVVTDIAISANHSKILLIENETWKVTVVSSANMTPNPRKEAGVLFTAPEVFDLYKYHLESSMKEGIPVNFWPMELNAEELEKVKEYAGLFLSLEDIAILLEKDLESFRAAFRNKQSELYKAYRLGQVTSKANLRRPVIKMASHGSPQAELLADKYITEQSLSELDEY